MEITRHGLSEVYTPEPEIQPIAHLELIPNCVIFVHGLFGHPQNTWTGHPSINANSKPQPRGQDSSTSLDSDVESDGISKGRKAWWNGKKYGRSARDASQGVFWPGVLLPKDAPDVRIFTWGYDADIDRLTSTASQNTIFQHAGDLLADVADLLESKGGDLPIIFVTHSLGGIIVKDALNQSSQAEAIPRLVKLSIVVHGVLFLGTPHHGSSSASIGKVFYKITEAATRRPNLMLFQGLKPNSETLDRIGQGFYQTITKRNIHVASFREQKETRRWAFFSTIVVDGQSATIGLPAEDISSIPEDHSGMTKFSSAKDIGFQRVSSQVRRWLNNYRETSDKSHDLEYEACLSSLNNGHTGLRIKNVSDSHARTFHWLYDTEIVTFVTWAQESSGSPIFWIQGKPGSGKSTLMKFAMKDPRTRAALGAPYTIAGFFFHDRGSTEQKSLSGMLQEVLYSILVQQRDLRRFVDPIFKDLCRSQHTVSPRWGFEALQSAFEAIVQQGDVSANLCIFLDALDEHQGNNRQLLDLVFRISSLQDRASVTVKFCLASRPWPEFTLGLSKYPGFKIHDRTRGDIQEYTRSRLSSEGNHVAADLDALVQQVTNKAHGVFIWVRLVVDLLAKDSRDGSSPRELEQRLAETPEELRDLYAHTLRRIDPAYAEEAHIMLQIALCALSPLPLETFVNAASVALRDENPESQSREAMLLRLNSRSGGLLEAVESTELDPSETVFGDIEMFHAPTTLSITVQFIHQTVKEYIQEKQNNLGLQRAIENGYDYLLKAASKGRGLSRKSSMVYEGILGFRKANAPILLGADKIALDVFKYAKMIETETPANCSALAALLETDNSRGYDTRLDWWISNSSFEFYRPLWRNTRSLDNETWLLCLLVAANLNKYLRLRWNLVKPSLSNRSQSFLLQVALTGPKTTKSDTTRANTLQTLLELGISSNLPIEEPLLCFGGIEIAYMMICSPLELLLMYGTWRTSMKIQTESEQDDDEIQRFDTFACLLKNGANPNFRCSKIRRDDYTRAALEPGRDDSDLAIFHCARHESVKLFRLLVAHGATIPTDFYVCAQTLWRKVSPRSTMLEEVLSIILPELVRPEQLDDEEDIGVGQSIFGVRALAQAGAIGACVGRPLLANLPPLEN
ncbi:uncharacterized protein PAC_19513 [Phialocephala subalpina]|uniref:NACHT domain-containing protein n=1 Tax=Phialocephala subalpina TaxID=576137 RepID=A0A1L7XX33_9HELO|nr:uncharacterized protein PAC_19513 [Phialocephala subalpina]